jgi:hypothetical protein
MLAIVLHPTTYKNHRTAVAELMPRLKCEHGAIREVREHTDITDIEWECFCGILDRVLELGIIV